MAQAKRTVLCRKGSCGETNWRIVYCWARRAHERLITLEAKSSKVDRVQPGYAVTYRSVALPRRERAPRRGAAIRGGTVCTAHGGRAPQVREAARLRLACLVTT